MSALYESCCDYSTESKLSVTSTNKLAGDLAAMVSEVWQNKGMPGTTNKNIVAAFATHLWGGIEEGYGKYISGIEYDNPDYEVLQNLQRNVYQFSAAKNYHQLKQLTGALIGNDGKLRSYNDFKNEAFKINNEHVNHWLRTEYDTAISSAQMAAKWRHIQDNKSVLPLLEFDAVVDNRTSEQCRSFNKVTKPVDDPFWEMYYPPNHFRCRSTVRQKSGGTITSNEAIIYPDNIPDMFKVNLAKRNLAFPPDHPYYNEAPRAVMIEGLKLLPLKQQYNTTEVFNKGSVREHFLVEGNRVKQYNRISKIATERAKQGHEVLINPSLSDNDSDLRKVIFPDAFKGKSPSVRDGGILRQIETPRLPLTIKSIGSRISSGAEICENIILNLETKFNEADLKELIQTKFGEHKNLKSVLVRMKGSKINYKEFKRY